MNDFPREEIFNLLNLIAKGNDKAFKKLYLQYQSSLRQFIRNYVNDDGAVDEILNDTFMALYKRPDGYDGSCKFSTWLCSIAIHKSKDWWRKQKRTDFMYELDEDAINEIPDDSQSILQTLEHKERNDVFMECMKRLPPNQREAMNMVFFNDEKLEAIAKMQDCPASTVKTRLFHARLKIKECVKSALGDGDLQ